MKKRRGVSLIELVLTLALIGLVLQVVYSIFFVGATSYSVSTNKGFSQQDIRLAVNYLESELKYVTQISTDPTFNGEYYSIHVEIQNGSPYLVKTHHNYTGDGTEANRDDMTASTEINRIPGNWNTLLLKNDINGEINIFLNQIETEGFKESGFEMTQIINTVNNPNLNTGLTVDFMAGNELFYRNSKLYLLDRGIDIDTSQDNSEVGLLVTIIFDSDGGSPVSSITAESGTYVDIPSDPIKNGYLFAGWYAELGGLGEKFSGSQIMIPNEDRTLYAHWITGTGQVTISDEIVIDGNVSPSKDGDRYIVERGNSGGSIVRIRLSGYDSAYEDYLEITVAGTEVAADESGWLNFSVIPPNGNGKTIDIKIIVKTSGYDEVSKTIGFISK